MTMKIVEFDEKALRQETTEVEIPPSGELKLLAAQMIKLMVAADGVGLAAPQVNRPERMFVAILNDEYHVFINPIIEELSESVGTEKEACLSLPGVLVPVRRSKIIRISYYDAGGKYHEKKKFKRMNARIIQHEHDHLQGVLISDYASDFELE